MIATAGGAMLGNLGPILFAVAIVVALLKLRRARVGRRVASWPYVLWGEIVFYAVGLYDVYAGISHAFLGIPVAFAELGIALVALLSLWRGFEMRLAATLVFAVFSLGTVLGHPNQIHNHAAGAAGPAWWFGDVVVPLVVLALAFLSRDAYERRAPW
ncbi:MAG TPA: DUF6790 family protein [Candidatus Baltobacteraceae bacterium]|jgi:hypothetical protein